MRRLLFVMMLAACSGEGGGDGTSPDASTPVIPPDLPYRYYVIDHITVPTTVPEADMIGMDLDGDGSVDNKLGNVISALSTLNVDAAATVNQSVDHGDTILLARVGTRSFVDADIATFQTYAGTDPSIPPCNGDSDTTCRHHLDGTASFTAQAEPAGKPLVGTFDGSAFNGSGGDLVIRIALFGSQPIDVVLMGSRAQLTMAGDTEIGKARLAGAVAQTDIDNKVIPAVQANMMVGVNADCTALTSPPDCGCAMDSDGKAAIAMFDKSPADCSITTQEIADNSLVQTLLSPDITINGTPGLTLGVIATAVRAQFTAP